jgi:isoquinoline 1-oxidoreductase beta subunit
MSNTFKASPAVSGMGRRTFLVLGAAAGAGLTLGLPMTASAADSTATFNPFVRIDPDGVVTVIVKHLDKGQGAATGLATLVAEELDADPRLVRTEFAPAHAATYKNFSFGDQGTGGSTAIANSFDQYRKAGATARDMLTRAAAEAWGIDPSSIVISNGRITQSGSQRDSGFGEFADRAARLGASSAPKLKRPEEWTFIGRSFPRVEVPEKAAGGRGLYGMDVQLPDMLVATVARPPRWGARLTGYDDDAAMQVNGVVATLRVGDSVAVLARSTWPAIKGRDALELKWDDSRADRRDTAELMREYRELVETPGLPAARHEDAESGLKRASKVIEATYEFPYLAHAPMEPLDVTVLFDGRQATIWSGSQLQTPDQQAAARVFGIRIDKVAINTLWAGGSFGRRGVSDAHYVAEAAAIAKAWGKAQPIKVVHTREDDITGGYYRPAYVHRVRAGIDDSGAITGWEHRIAGQSIIKGTPYEPYIVRNGVDRLSVEGVQDMTYAVDKLAVELHTAGEGVPVLWWRSVGHSHTAYAVETMIDRLAEAAGIDPVMYRLRLLRNDSRLSRVLVLAAEKVRWSHKPEPGLFRGVAVHRSFKTAVAQIAEVRLSGNGTVKVTRVVAAVDCGIAVNPDNVRAQIEGSIGYGLGAVLRNQITMKDGLVQQTNFDTYEPLRIDDMPKVEVHIVPSTARPTGVGEPGTPPIGPAVANAIFRATGQALTELPFSRHGLA